MLTNCAYHLTKLQHLKNLQHCSYLATIYTIVKVKPLFLLIYRFTKTLPRYTRFCENHYHEKNILTERYSGIDDVV
jgi:hypothetical protein